MASIEKRGGRWRVRWHDEHGIHRSRSAPDRATAQWIKLEIERGQALGQPWDPAELGRPLPTLWSLAERYLREQRARLAPRTVARKEQFLGVWLRHLHRELGRDPRVEDLSRAALADYHGALLDPATGRHLHGRRPTTAAKHIHEIEYFWRWLWSAAEDLGLEVPRPRSLELRRQPPARREAPTWDEMDRAIGALRGWHRDVAVLCRCTGLRVDQVMRLEWSDLDLERARLRVRPELGKTAQERRGRTVPIAAVLVRELAGWGVREGFVVRSERDLGPRHREARARDAARGWQRAGVRPEVWQGRPWHAFRAGFQTGLRRAGVAGDSIDYLVGHSRGLDEHYIDGGALGLVEAVGIVPPIAAVLDRRAVR